MQYLVLFVAIAILGVALVVGFRPRTAPAARLDSSPPILGLSEPEPVLPPVLLPERPTGQDVGALRLSPALRGYRCDQVDAVLDALGEELDRLRAQLPTESAETQAEGAVPGETLPDAVVPGSPEHLASATRDAVAGEEAVPETAPRHAD